MRPAINGTEQRLDVVLEELRALRQEVAQLRPSPVTITPSGATRLREPAQSPAPEVTTAKGMQPKRTPRKKPDDRNV